MTRGGTDVHPDDGCAFQQNVFETPCGHHNQADEHLKSEYDIFEHEDAEHISCSKATDGVPKRTSGSMLFIDIGKLVTTAPDGTEKIEEMNTPEASNKNVYTSSCDSGNDGDSFLSPVTPFTPENKHNFKIVSSITVMNTGLKMNEKNVLKPTKSVNNRNGSFSKLPEAFAVELQQKIEKNIGDTSFRQNYGNGSQPFSKIAPASTTGLDIQKNKKSISQKRLSFADDNGEDNIVKVTETNDLYYSVNKTLKTLKIERSIAFIVVLAILATSIFAAIYATLVP